MPLRSRRNKEANVNQGIIQNAIENKSVINGVELRDVSDPEMKFESEQPTLADLIVPGTGRSISAELECLLSVICAGGKFS
jgi:hypothetical protein